MKIIKPTKVSRPVEFKDLWKVIRDSWRIKWAMLTPFEGTYPFAVSISHCQIEPEDPLRFFVVDKQTGINPATGREYRVKVKTFLGFPWARTIINPKIVWHGKKVLNHREGCMSLGGRARKIKRWQIVEMEYWTFFGKRKKKLWEGRAIMSQHEVDHMDLINQEEVYRKKVVHKSSYKRP